MTNEESQPDEIKRLDLSIAKPCLLFVIVLLVAGVAILALSQPSPLSTTERKIIGEWIVSGGLGKMKYEFRDDRTFEITQLSTGKLISHSRWRAHHQEFKSIINTGTITDRLNDLRGWKDAEEFQIEFHDPDTFELYLTHPKGYGDRFFKRVEEP